MTDLAGYSLSDFLLFSPRAYERMFVLHNEDWWPLQIIAGGMGAAILFACLRPDPDRLRLALAATGAGWMFVGWFFFPGRYAAINWAGSSFGPVALVEGALLVAMALGLGLRRDTGIHPDGPYTPSIAGVASLAVLAFAVLAYPAVAAAFGRAPASGQVAGLMPDPTAAASLAVLFLAAPWPAWLRMTGMIVPVSWLVFSALTTGTLGWWDFLVPTVLLAVLLVAAVVSRGRAFRTVPHKA